MMWYPFKINYIRYHISKQRKCRGWHLIWHLIKKRIPKVITVKINNVLTIQLILYVQNYIILDTITYYKFNDQIFKKTNIIYYIYKFNDQKINKRCSHEEVEKNNYQGLNLWQRVSPQQI